METTTCDENEVLTLQETADFLKLHVQTVRRLLKEEKLPGVRVGNRWRVLKSELVDYLRTPYADRRQVPQGTTMENSSWVPINAATCGGSGSRTQKETKYADLLGLGTNGKRRSLKSV